MNSTTFEYSKTFQLKTHTYMAKGADNHRLSKNGLFKHSYYFCWVSSASELYNKTACVSDHCFSPLRSVTVAFSVYHMNYCIFEAVRILTTLKQLFVCGTFKLQLSCKCMRLKFCQNFLNLLLFYPLTVVILVLLSSCMIISLQTSTVFSDLEYLTARLVHIP